VFDIRYHALSLAAVLIALVVGLLLGVAIGDANLVSSAEKGVSSSLRKDITAAQRANTKLRRQLAVRRRYEDQIYPTLVSGQLPRRRIGLVFLGASSDRLVALVRAALVETGADLRQVVVVREPPDLNGLSSAAAGTSYGQLARNPGLVRTLGQRVGSELVRGVRRARGRLLDRVKNVLFSSSDGSLDRLDAMVVVRDHPPLPSAGRGLSDQLDAGLLEGLTSTNVPVVGGELTSTNPSQVPWYRQQNLDSVDDLDDISGRLALVFALAGAHGAYGQKQTAEALLPRGANGLR